MQRNPTNNQVQPEQRVLWRGTKLFTGPTVAQTFWTELNFSGLVLYYSARFGNGTVLSVISVGIKLCILRNIKWQVQNVTCSSDRLVEI